jgi:hypothetical protein
MGYDRWRGVLWLVVAVCAVNTTMAVSHSRKRVVKEQGIQGCRVSKMTHLPPRRTLFFLELRFWNREMRNPHHGS